MSESNYHLEALRKQRVIERKKDAMAKLTKGQHDTCADPGDVQQTKDTILFTGPGDYDYNRNIPDKFRVSNEGYQNRYRDRHNLAPHCDLAYAVIYPGKDNSDYTSDQNRNNT
uniref:Uncharacterized protein n=1 Tax=Pinctada fucata TaxID=50426 RepID=A0A194AM39_PINFU